MEPYRYRYRSLDPGSIRVLHLEPNDGCAPLRCRIEQVAAFSSSNDDSGPAYEAISYVWGDPSQQKLIDCIEGCVSVPENLYDALLQLRIRGQGTVFWADSICINQSDANEKSDQVARMGSIFSKASHVVLWQGKEDAETQGALLALNELLDVILDSRYASLSAISRKRRRRLEETAARLQKKGSVPPEKMKQYDFTGIDWPAIVALFQRPYFSRLWIVQEVVLAQKATIMCGSQQLEWQGAAVFGGHSASSDKAFLNACTIIQKIGLAAGVLARQNLGLMYNVAFIPSFVSTLDHIGDKLMVVVIMNFVLGVQDLRDRLYGGLHLIPELSQLEDWELRPDYSLSTEEVFHRLAVWLVCKQSVFNYLTQATLQPPSATIETSEGQRVEQALPSWVPHPYRDGPRVVLTERSVRNFVRPEPDSKFGWAGGYARSGSMPFAQAASISSDRRYLTLSGKLVAKVDRIYGGKPEEPDILSHDRFSDELTGGSDDKGMRRVGALYARSLARQTVAHLKLAVADLFPDSWQEKFSSEDFTIVMMAFDAGQTDLNKFNDEDGSNLHRLMRCIANIRAYLRGEEDEVMHKDDNSFRILRNYRILRKVYHMSARRRLFKSEDGRLGLIGKAAEPGDIVAVIYGTMAPLVLRMDESGTATLVGACTLGDITLGAALARDDIPTTTITMQ